jgi:elongation factor P--(R)-beta-lysine ligase
MTAVTPWWDPARHADKRPFLEARGQIKRALRAWFDARGFTEIEAGQLQVSPGNETHLHALATEIVTPDAVSSRMYLHTSPEFACKKLLAAGETQIYDFARVFRNREAGPLHATEFTMLEWYRAGADWQAVMDDTLALMRAAAAAVPTDGLVWRDHKVLVARDAIRLTLQDAFANYAQIDLLATVDENGEGIRDLLAQAAQSQNIRVTEDDSWSDIFSKVLVEKIEPFLGLDAPTSCVSIHRAKQHSPANAPATPALLSGLSFMYAALNSLMALESSLIPANSAQDLKLTWPKS